MRGGRTAVTAPKPVGSYRPVIFSKDLAFLSGQISRTADGKILLCLPGSENAVRLGMTRLILPELGHLVRELSR